MKRVCTYSDSRCWKTLKHCVTEKMSWGWERRPLKSKIFLKTAFFFCSFIVATSFIECLCVCVTIGLVRFMQRKSRQLRSCWGGENWLWRPWRTHMSKSWRMTYPGLFFFLHIFMLVWFVSAHIHLEKIIGCHMHSPILISLSLTF